MTNKNITVYQCQSNFTIFYKYFIKLIIFTIFLNRKILLFYLQNLNFVLNFVFRVQCLHFSTFNFLLNFYLMWLILMSTNYFTIIIINYQNYF